MDQDSQDGKPLRSLFMRHRSPTFSKEEIQTLVNLIARHKNIINSKSCNNIALQAKEVAWSKIAKKFNAQGFTHHRSVECLKIKWVNLKKEAKKTSKNLIDDGQGDFDELTSQIVAMVCEAENNTNEISMPKDLEDEFNDLQSETNKDLKDDSMKYWQETEDKEENKTSDSKLMKKEGYTRFKKRINRSMNFTPQECRLLLQCVRREKKYVFSKESSSRAITLKHRAWARISANFNRQSENKRSTKMLWNKLSNMKRLTRHEGLLPGSTKLDGLESFRKSKDELENQKVKLEPAYDLDDDTRDGVDAYTHDDVASDNEQNVEAFDVLRNETENSQNMNIAPDPLSIVLNADSGIGSINMDSFNSESSEVTKLKLELLKYQLENAKLERKRIEDATQASAKDQEARAAETALRVRAARLECVAAELRLPPAHPALLYTAEEMRAKQYMDQYHPT